MKKPLFESEEEARQFLSDCIYPYVSTLLENDYLKSKLEESR